MRQAYAPPYAPKQEKRTQARKSLCQPPVRLPTEGHRFPSDHQVWESVTPPLTIHLFGPLRVAVNGAPLPRVRTRSVEWLLALLALRGGRAVSRAWLAGALWPESSGSRALQNLRNDLVLLRHALGPESG